MKKSFELPKEFGEKWLTALRSGDYKQTHSMLLNDNNCYCCLGVAGKICDVDENYMINTELFDNDPLYYKESGIPEVLIHSSITNDLEDYTLVDVLTSLNDSFTEDCHRKSIRAFPNLIFRKEFDFKSLPTVKFNFKDIADFIKDNTEFV